MAVVVSDRDWSIVDGNGDLSADRLDCRGYTMIVLQWLARWWLVLVVCSLSIHISGELAYRAGRKSAEAREYVTHAQPSQADYAAGLLSIMERLEMQRGKKD